MFEALVDRIEGAVDNPAELVALRARVDAASVTDGERERLHGLIDRYEQDARLADEAAETAQILHEEGLDAGT